jgi:hypothetical protein
MKKIIISTLLVLTTQISIAEEDWQYTANHSYPPMVSAIDMPKFIVNEKTYNLNWQLTGYLDEYDSFMQFFTSKEKKAFFPNDSSVKTDTGWAYRGDQYIKLFDYKSIGSVDFDIEKPTQLQMRFYKKSSTDTIRTAQYGSALISTNRKIKFEPSDTRGRILKTTILPNTPWYTGKKTIHYGGYGLNKEDTFEVDFTINNIDPERGWIDYTFLIEADDGLQKGSFIAVIDSKDDFLRYPGKNQEFKYKTDDGDWITLADPSSSGTKMKQFTSVLSSIAGVYVPIPDSISQGAGILSTAMDTTKLLFNVLDSEWWVSGMSSDEAKMLPNIDFFYDSSDLSFSKTYRLSLPQSKHIWSDDIVSHKFTIRIKHDWTKAKVLPRFYMKITNNNDINEEATLQIGNHTSLKHEDYIKDGKINTRWIQAYEQ